MPKLMKERTGSSEEYYRRATDADPTQANNLGNFAQMLFALGRDDEAVEMLDRAARGAPNPDFSLELAFYQYAHVSDERDAALGERRRLIADGVPSPGWDLSANVERATTAGHPEPGLLADLAKVIAEDAPADTLDRYPAWRLQGAVTGPQADNFLCGTH